MKPTPEFLRFCQGLHQDIGAVQSNTDDVARACLNNLKQEDRAKLESFVSKAMTKCTDAELKGLLRRSSSDWNFSSAAARALFNSALRQLQGPS